MKLYAIAALFSFVSLCLTQTPAHSQLSVDSLLKALKAKEKEAVGKPFGAFRVTNEHSPIANDNFLGRVVFINFWFESCKPCVAEFEGLNKLYIGLQQDKNFAFVSFTFEKPQTITKVRERYNLAFPIYSISEEECQRLNLNSGYPTTIILDKKGIIQYFKTGGSSDSKEATQMVLEEFYPKIKELLQY